VVRETTTRKAAADLLRRVGLAGYENAYPRQLSGGMQRRVALARAFSVNPRLLLLDEPFVSLDHGLVAEVQSVFLDMIHDDAPTAILVTHLPEDAARLANRAIVMRGMPASIVADIDLGMAPTARKEADLHGLVEMISGYGARPAL
jgi:ABC-type nitrate/sulfonate/bicarbonate transport system ATPase subunit